MVKIKIPVTITTKLFHTDNPDYGCVQPVGEQMLKTEIEVEASDEVIAAFKVMWIKNRLQVTVSGSKTFVDGEEIA